MVIRPHTREEVQASIEAGGWTIAWGSPVPEANLVKFIAPVPSGNASAWVTQNISAQLMRQGQSPDTVSRDAIDQAGQFLSGLQAQKLQGEAEIAGIGVKAGVAIYYGTPFTLFGNPLPEPSWLWQPYFGLRVAQSLPPKPSLVMQSPVQFDSGVWYKIINHARPEMVLDVVNHGRPNQPQDGSLKLAADGHYSGQYWQLRPCAPDASTYSLCTMWLGSGMCLGWTSYNKTSTPQLAEDFCFEQQWCLDYQGDGTWRLRNAESMEMLCAEETGNHVVLAYDQTSPLGKWVVEAQMPITQSGFQVEDLALQFAQRL